ncbi:uncharacterized protein LOC62_01G000647 [Vanrija pseudolonga]|uniref:Uncharacterized protein n=1 Tax=Vanrija pseudolonga TaxID=143232 RepID=A0AAF0XZU1_9TREE|nr:hypothetical protein LOC62_01G000647 [Vanrija pseudolonga]
MSAQDAPSTQKKTSDSGNPASLSTDPRKKVDVNKPDVKPPLKDVPMGRFLTYLTFGLLALSAFYLWRFTVWAHNAGGYINLLTGRRDYPPAGVAAAAAAAHESAVAADKHTGPPTKKQVQDQIFKLADMLGVKPAELSAAIRPLVDPTVNKAAEREAPAGGEETAEPGLFNIVGEILLD